MHHMCCQMLKRSRVRLLWKKTTVTDANQGRIQEIDKEGDEGGGGCVGGGCPCAVPVTLNFRITVRARFLMPFGCDFCVQNLPQPTPNGFSWCDTATHRQVSILNWEQECLQIICDNFFSDPTQCFATSIRGGRVMRVFSVKSHRTSHA